MALTISEVARLAGVNVETVRFYERRGLLAEPPRRSSGYRDYPPEAVHRLQFIHRAKELGFTLNEIRELLDLHASEGGSCSEVRAITAAKLAAVESRIAELTAVRDALRSMVQSCEGARPLDECPILETLEATETESSSCCRTNTDTRKGQNTDSRSSHDRA